MNLYAEKLEQLIAEMKRAEPQVTAREYQQWLSFLKSIHPESELLKRRLSVKQITDVRELMLIAEAAAYPTWYIQPKILGLVAQVKYNEGMLQSVASKQQTLAIKDIEDLPPNIPEFSGIIKGAIVDKKFVAYDLDTDMPFLQKMQLLKDGGVAAAEYVAFPTNRIPSISSVTLETYFHNYIQQANQAYPVDGLVIISDTVLTDGTTEFTRMVYKWQLSNE